MKKFISLLMATMMIVSFAVVSHAEGNSVLTISTAEVAQNAVENDAKATITYTFDLPAAVSVFSVESEVTFDKTKLKLDSYTLTNTGLATGGQASDWVTTDSNLDKDYGAYLYFDGSSCDNPANTDRYVMTLNFTVIDTSAATDIVLGLQKFDMTDENFGFVFDTYPLSNMDATGKISVKGAEAQLPEAGVAKADAAAIEATKDAANRVTVAALGTINVTADTKPVTKATVTVSAPNGKKATSYTHTFTLPTNVLSGGVKVAINVRNVPAAEAANVTFAIAVAE